MDRQGDSYIIQKTLFVRGIIRKMPVLHPLLFVRTAERVDVSCLA